jgi:hypothetical protein
MAAGSGKAKMFFEVSCDRHGTSGEKNVPNFKRIAVGRPSSRGKGKHFGCPICKREKSQG